MEKLMSYNEKYVSNSKIAAFCGSFDPFHIGHKVLVERFLPLFDKVVIAIGINDTKKGHYSIEERKEIIRKMMGNNPKIEIESYNGLTVDFCKEIGAKYMLRGMRDSKDFEWEKAVDNYNKGVAPDIETIYMIATKDVEGISSTQIRKEMA